MSNMMRAGALALALVGFAAGSALPAEAATYHAPGVTVNVVSHAYGTPWWWAHHPRPKVKVCSTSWHHGHKVTTCVWKPKPWHK